MDRVTLVVTLPVRDVNGDPKVVDALRDAWRLSTDLANWCQRELAMHDARREPNRDERGVFDTTACEAER